MDHAFGLASGGLSPAAIFLEGCCGVLCKTPWWMKAWLAIPRSRTWKGNNRQIRRGRAKQTKEQIKIGGICRERESAHARYRQLAGTGKTTTDIREAVRAAHHGRIEVLFVAVGVQIGGGFDPEKNKVDVPQIPKPGDGDLLDLTAIQTLVSGFTGRSP